MRSKLIQSNFLLLLTAAIWGLGFVAQRAGMDYVGPYTYNGIRFLLGGISLMPLILLQKNGKKPSEEKQFSFIQKYRLPLGGFVAGLALFAGATFQQVGIQYTTAGKAGFITGLYVVIVPFLGLFFNQRAGAATFAGAILAAAGLYLLCITGSFTMAMGDLLVFICAFGFAIHVIVIGYFSPRVDPLKLSCLQFLFCGAISMLIAILIENMSLTAVLNAAFPIIFGGLFSVGVAYTLQVIAQQYANPSHSAVILSLESAFAALGGWLVLGETLNDRAMIGCFLMLIGMIVSQLSGKSLLADETVEKPLAAVPESVQDTRL